VSRLQHKRFFGKSLPDLAQTVEQEVPMDPRTWMPSDRTASRIAIAQRIARRGPSLSRMMSADAPLLARGL
jgi:hypothetical protein